MINISFITALGTTTSSPALTPIHGDRQLETGLSTIARYENELPRGLGHQSASRATTKRRHRDCCGRIAASWPLDCRGQRQQLPRTIPVHGTGQEHLLRYHRIGCAGYCESDLKDHSLLKTLCT